MLLQVYIVENIIYIVYVVEYTHAPVVQVYTRAGSVRHLNLNFMLDTRICEVLILEEASHNVQVDYGWCLTLLASQSTASHFFVHDASLDTCCECY